MSDNIYQFLKQKSISNHYIKRYIKFIEKFNGSGSISHHILPKANDMFPEYKNLKTYEWNRCLLGEREHFIAHWILWKALGKSQTFAFFAMKNKDGQNLNSKSYKLLLEDIKANHPMKIENIKNLVIKKTTITNKKRGTYKKTSERFNAVDNDGVKWASKIGKLGIPNRLIKNSNSLIDGAKKAAETNKNNGVYGRRSQQLINLWQNDEYRSSASNSMALTKKSEKYKKRNTHYCNFCNKSIIGKGNLKQHESKCG